MTRAEVWAKNWAKNWEKYSAHFRASLALQNDPQIFSQNSSQFITPCLVAEISKFHLRELLGFGGNKKIAAIFWRPRKLPPPPERVCDFSLQPKHAGDCDAICDFPGGKEHAHCHLTGEGTFATEKPGDFEIAIFVALRLRAQTCRETMGYYFCHKHLDVGNKLSSSCGKGSNIGTRKTHSLPLSPLFNRGASGEGGACSLQKGSIQ